MVKFLIYLIIFISQAVISVSAKMASREVAGGAKTSTNVQLRTLAPILMELNA